MGEKEIRINYETLFELLRREKTKDELQKLEDSFFEDVVSYVNEKRRILEEQKARLENFFSAVEKEKMERQTGNIRKIIKELYERRERKILLMAVNASKLGKNIIDTSALLKEERMMYESLVELFDNYRNNIMLTLIEGKIPSLAETMPVQKEAREEIGEVTISSTESDKKTVRFIKPISKFVGEELEIYGPYDEQETAILPKNIADVLINKGHAVEFEGD